MTPKIDKQIVKYISKSATAKDLDELSVWIQYPNNKILFKEYVKTHYIINYAMNNSEQDRGIERLLLKIRKDKKVIFIKKIKSFTKYAAVILVIFSASIFYFSKLDINNNDLNIVSNVVTLKTERGKVKTINENVESLIKGSNGNIIGNQKGNSITYNKNSNLDKLVYNTITVPYGKRFTINLSDGTKVNLNSGTSFKYPINFLKGQERKVFIETGEAFFNVKKDENHPFIVNNRNINIKVLGTEFNVSSYPEDDRITTFLVEGSIELSQNNSLDKIKLTPGYKASYSKTSKNLDVSKADFEVHTAWLKGKIVIKYMKFGDIINKLERRYDVSIESSDAILNNEFITATFENETISQVLEVINKLHPIDYKIKGNQILISKYNK
ncbi:hypothetical protein BST83_01375 [Polaribacter filamentus]|uniref:Iron dicitrate transport regulator FecR n=2 Tax=Polaribacter filamentus TaxID=53483 RepID=A0A2S7L2G0_9FLAO|nr:hypothetical protein BST83_01375 [Polaribacter filamentus]